MPDSPLIVSRIPALTASPVSRRRVLQGTGITALAALLGACSNSSDSSPDAQSTANAVSKEIDTLAVGFPALALRTCTRARRPASSTTTSPRWSARGSSPPTASACLSRRWPRAGSRPRQRPTSTRCAMTQCSVTAYRSPIDDVIYSIGMAQDKKISPNIAYYWANTKSVEKTADNEVTITLDSPDVAFEWGPCAANALWVTSQEFVESNNGEIGTPSTLIYGTGPYKVTKFEPDSMVELERVDTWWGGTAPVKTVRIDFIPEESNAPARPPTGRHRHGDQHLARPGAGSGRTPRTPRCSSPPNRSYVGIDFYTSASSPSTTSTSAGPSPTPATARPTWSSCSMVMAKSQPRSPPREQIEGVYGPEGAREALSVVLDLPYDLEAAKSELAQSKVPDGFTTKVGISQQCSTGQRCLPGRSSRHVEPLGIIIEIDEMPVEQWYDTIGSKDWGLAYMDYTSTTGDPAEMSTWFLGPYGNPRGTPTMKSPR